MANTIQTYVGDGSTTIYTFNFDYIKKAFVKVLVDGAEVGFTLTDTYTVTLDAAPAVNAVVVIQRVTDSERLVDFVDGSILIAKDLNVSALQALHIAQEARDKASGSLLIDDTGAYTAGFRRLADLGDPTEPRDAVNRQWAETAMSSELAQATSAKDAAETARDASVNAKVAAETAKDGALTAQTAAETAQAASETAGMAARTAARNAETAESNASDHATAASSSASSAASSAASAALRLDDFDDRYLGAKSSDPATDNDGDALVAGALYFNTTDGEMKVYNGSEWRVSYISDAGVVLESELTDGNAVKGLDQDVSRNSSPVFEKLGFGVVEPSALSTLDDLHALDIPNGFCGRTTPSTANIDQRPPNSSSYGTVWVYRYGSGDFVLFYTGVGSGSKIYWQRYRGAVSPARSQWFQLLDDDTQVRGWGPDDNPASTSDLNYAGAGSLVGKYEVNSTNAPPRRDGGSGAGFFIQHQWNATGKIQFAVPFHTAAEIGDMFVRQGLDGSWTDWVNVGDKYSIGMGQKWRSMTAARAAETSYQNTTGKPIAVAVKSDSGNDLRKLQVADDGVTFLTVDENGNSNKDTLHAIVPSGHYYRVKAGFSDWRELR